MFNRWSFFSYFITFIIMMPIIMVINHAMGVESQTLIHLKETVLTAYVTDTLTVVLGVALLTLILGVGTAYVTTFYDFRFAGILVFSLALPFTIPTYIMGYIYADIFGYFNHFHLFLRSLGIKEYFNVLNIYSVIIVMSLALYPYVYLIVKASFEKSKSALLNPALSLGSSRKKVFFEIILPLSRPAIIGSLALVMMESISEYGVTEYYNVKTLTPVIFNTWFGLHDSRTAAFLAVIAMLMVLAVLMIEKLSRGKASYATQNANGEVKKEKLKGFKLHLTYFLISLPVIFGFIIPFIWILVYSYTYMSTIFDDGFIKILSHSFVTSGIAAFIIVVLAFLVSYTSRIYPAKVNQYPGKIMLLGFTMPGAMIAIGIIMFFADSDRWLIDHYVTTGLFFSGTLFTLIFSYIIRFSAIGIQSVDSTFERISFNLNKASRSLGYNYFKTMFKVEIPLMKKTLLFAYILVFVSIVKELPMTLVLRPFNYETLSTKTYTLANAQMLQQTSIYALFIIVVSLVPLSILLLKRFR